MSKCQQDLSNISIKETGIGYITLTVWKQKKVQWAALWHVVTCQWGSQTAAWRPSERSPSTASSTAASSADTGDSEPPLPVPSHLNQTQIHWRWRTFKEIWGKVWTCLVFSAGRLRSSLEFKLKSVWMDKGPFQTCWWFYKSTAEGVLTFAATSADKGASKLPPCGQTETKQESANWFKRIFNPVSARLLWRFSYLSNQNIFQFFTQRRTRLNEVNWCVLKASTFNPNHNNAVLGKANSEFTQT